MTAPVTEAKWKLVPVEPSNAMVDAAIEGDNYWSINAIPRIVAAYNAMLAASPTPPPSEDKDAQIAALLQEVERLHQPPDPARAIASLFQKATDEEKQAFNMLVRAAQSIGSSRIAAERKVVEAARESVVDRRKQFPEESPRWSDCGCGGPQTEKLADALAALRAAGKETT